MQRGFGLPDDLVVLSYAAPQPPADGGPEVLAWIQRWKGLEWRVDRMRVAPGTELVDRDAYTALQARLQAAEAERDELTIKNRSLHLDMETIASRNVPVGLPIAEFAAASIAGALGKHGGQS